STSYILLFFNATATSATYTLSLHDALPIFFHRRCRVGVECLKAIKPMGVAVVVASNIRIGFVAVEVARTVSTHSGVATYQKSAHFDFAGARQGVYRGTSDQWTIVKGEENMFRVLIKLFTQGIAVLALLYFDVDGG